MTAPAAPDQLTFDLDGQADDTATPFTLATTPPPAYKPTPPTPRRPLPDGWRWVKLGDVCDLISGNTLPLFQETDEAGRIFCIKVSDLSGVFWDGFTLSGTSYYTNRKLAGNQIVEPGAVVFPKRGGAIATNKKRTVIVHAVLDPNMMAAQSLDNEILLPTYLRWWFESWDLTTIQSGNTVPQLNKQDLAPLEIPLPPTLDEQKRIAAILAEQLGAVERARAATQAQLKAARALPAAYLRAVFDSPQAQQWEKKRLGDICTIDALIVDPTKPEYRQLPHVNGENIEGGTCRLTYLHSAEEDKMTSGKYLFDAGDVLYSKLRPYLRKVVVVDFRGLCSADMYPIKVNANILDPFFTGWLLLSDDFTNYANEESRRARMPKLNREQLFAFTASIPALTEQKRIAAELTEKLAEAERLRVALQAQLDSINALPAALLRRAFNGEL